jgi:hypothetical protein
MSQPSGAGVAGACGARSGEGPLILNTIFSISLDNIGNSNNYRRLFHTVLDGMVS